MSKKTGSKAKKALITILVVLLALVAIVFIGARIYFRAPVSAYYKASEKAFVIPGLWDNMVPQGLDYVASTDTYLICGYQKDGSSSRIYRVTARAVKIPVMLSWEMRPATGSSPMQAVLLRTVNICLSQEMRMRASMYML